MLTNAVVVYSTWEYVGLGIMTVAICLWWMWVRKMFDGQSSP